MGFRHINISSPGKISIENNTLVFSPAQSDQDRLKIPLDDISVLILENRQIVLSSYVLSVLAEKDIAVFFCDAKHLPIGLSLPFQSFGTQKLRIEEQVKLTLPFRKQIWAKIIATKIYNQSLHLKKLKKEEHSKLLELSKRILSGDSDNKEAQASKIYFAALFGNNFSRDDEDNIVNILLNYSYSLVRGSISRELVAHGFIPSIGIFHKNQYNNFNLSDDFIEPFRPSIDSRVIEMVKYSQINQISPKIKEEVLKIFGELVLQENKKVTIKQSIEITIKSFVSSINSNSVQKLLLPKFL
jgi:CRISPR-associated protein Cas1